MSMTYLSTWFETLFFAYLNLPAYLPTNSFYLQVSFTKQSSWIFHEHLSPVIPNWSAQDERSYIQIREKT